MSTPTRYLVIKASAGSGKTYRITREVTERLSRTAADGTPEFRPSEIIATTFTRRAAAELSDRIRGRLVDAGLLNQAAAVPTALIGTVNSVTGRILGDFAVDAGRSPELSVLSETARERAFTLATDAVLADAEDRHRSLLARTGYDLGPSEEEMFHRPRNNWARTVRQVIDLARANDLGPDEVEACAGDSVTSLFAVLDTAGQGGGVVSHGPVRDTVIEALHRITAGQRTALGSGTVRKNSVGPLEELIAGAEKFLTEVATSPFHRRRVTWKQWFDAAKGILPDTRRPSKPWADAFVDAVPVTAFAADETLRSDLAALVRLVFTTAASCMRAYAEYKQALGLIDFTDQEQLTLQLLREDSDRGRLVRETLSQRYRILVVDEFQDTSPLQLALFTELGALVDEVIWVGDPKQSIYGFRGADPSLMSSALDAITDAGGDTAVLNHSWRTREVPLDLTNRLFTRVFDVPSDEVELSIPGELADRHTGGDVRVWTPGTEGRANALRPWFTRIARGLTDLENAEGVPEKGRAVLTRTNAHADTLRETLRGWGIPTEGGGTPLQDTREGQVLRAACARLLDSTDTQALVELVCLLNDHASHDTWFAGLTAAPDQESRDALFAAWAQDPALRGLDTVRARMPLLTVPETVAAVIDALDLRNRVASWTGPAARTGAVTGLLQAATDYTADTDGAGRPATLTGFLAYLIPDPADRTAIAPTTLEARDPASVVVTTIHQAKGLEWDTVVVMPPLPSDRFRAAGVWVHSPTALHLDNPLADRTIRFWPETLLTGDAMEDLLRQTPEQLERRAGGQLEEQRLLYVAMTRSRRRTVLAPHRSLADLAAFSDTPLSFTEVTGVESLSEDAGDSPEPPRTGLQVTWPGGSDIIDCPVGPVSQDEDVLLDLLAGQATPDTPPAALIDDARGPAVRQDTPVRPAAFAPSGVPVTQELANGATVRKIADLGPALVERGGKDWNLVGDCIHSYLAAPLAVLDEATKRQVADRLIASWRVHDKVTAAQVVECGDRWLRFLDGSLHVTAVDSEVPFTWTNADHQRAEGWIDQLLTVPGDGDGADRRIIVDHKTYPGNDPVGHVRDEYLGQMDVYRRALTEITGTVPARILIHLPLLGQVLEVVLP